MIFTLLFLAACRPTVPVGPDVFLISLDTTRADALSAWGLAPAGREDLRGAVTTPNLDALAAQGVRYRWAFAHVPSTLASHATVFTGLDPHDLDIPRNGFPLSAEPETLAERVHKLGWTTAAVLGSSSLARPMGVDRGFETWDEQFSVNRRRRHEATAAEVTDRALAILAARGSSSGRAPLFLFVHYYDPHGPYQAPGPGRFRTGSTVTPQVIERLSRACRKGACDDPANQSAIEQVRGAYLDEVAYVDEQVGRLLSSPVGPRGRVVVVFGDHGEALGEEPDRPFGHGSDVDPFATHVPVIVVAPGLVPAVVDTPIGLHEVGGMLLRQLGDPHAFGKPPGPTIPMEATQPAEQTWSADVPRSGAGSWNNLQNERGIVGGTDLVIAAPWLGEGPRWWRLGDPVTPLDAAPSGEAAPLLQALEAWDARAPAFRSIDMSPETREGLKALGYEE